MTEHRIATTLAPDRELLVDDRELLDLERMGLVARRIPDATPATSTPSPPATRRTRVSKGDTDGSTEEGQPEADG